MILDLSPIVKHLEQSQVLIEVVAYFDIPKILEYLMVSPDIYDCVELYDFIYQQYGEELHSKELIEITDEIDEVYRQLLDLVSQRIKTKYAQTPYTFHRWVTPTAAILGDADLTPPWEDRQDADHRSTTGDPADQD